MASSRALFRRSSAYARSRSSSAWSGIAVAEIEPAAVAQHAAEGERPIADRVGDARELDDGGVDAADIGAHQRAHGAHADREVGHVAGGQQREARVGMRDALAAEAELARGIGGNGVQGRAARGRHVGGGGNRVGELRQGGGRIAEGELLDGRKIAGLCADARRVGAVDSSTHDNAVRMTARAEVFRMVGPCTARSLRVRAAVQSALFDRIQFL